MASPPSKVVVLFDTDYLCPTAVGGPEEEVRREELS
jgi:hypothetical protein